MVFFVGRWILGAYRGRRAIIRMGVCWGGLYKGGVVWGCVQFQCALVRKIQVLSIRYEDLAFESGRGLVATLGMLGWRCARSS